MKKVVILFDRGASPDAALVDTLRSALSQAKYQAHVDLHLKISVDWATSITEQIRKADALIVVVSQDSMDSEMLEYELEVANDAKLKNRSMKMIFVPIGAEVAARGAAGPLLGGYQATTWEGDSDTAPLIAEILEVLERPMSGSATEILIGTAGGGISGDSPFYIEREADGELRAQVASGEATTLIKGPRQSGKTSLMAKGIRQARELGCRTCVTDFQRMGSNLFTDQDEFHRMLAANLARQMQSAYGLDWDWGWDPVYGPASNLDEFVRSMIAAAETRIVWFMDEADWLFASPFADSFFALVRSWHNSRALSPDGLWNQFSVVIAYATEAHLFIQDINQSPFNVGTRIELSGFTLRQTEALNERYGSPLRGIDQVSELQDLLDGQPFLTRTAFDVLMKSNGNLRGLLASADRNEGPFGDHLRRVLVSVTQLSVVRETLNRVLANAYVETSPQVGRLVAAGILVKNSSGNHVIRCKLYRKYLEQHLK